MWSIKVYKHSNKAKSEEEKQVIVLFAEKITKERERDTQRALGEKQKQVCYHM